MTKRPPADVVHKYPQSRQPVKIDHVENRHEGQSGPSQQLQKDRPQQREAVDHQKSLPNLLCVTSRRELNFLARSHHLEDHVYPIVVKYMNFPLWQ